MAASKTSQPTTKEVREQEPSFSNIKPRDSGIQPPTESSVSTSSYGGIDLRINLEAKRRAKRQNEVTMAYIRDRVSEQTWHKGDVTFFKEWLNKNLRDVGLEPLCGSRELLAARLVEADSEKARANAKSRKNLKGKGKGKRSSK